MITLYLVRHARTLYSDCGRIAGSTDVALSNSGREATAILAASGVPDVSDCYCSDLQRSIQTSQILCAKTPLIDPRIRELDFGEWEQRTWDDIYAEDPGSLSHWSNDWVNRSPPGGETFSDLAVRCNDWLQELIPLHNEATILVTAHGGSIRALLCVALQLPLSVAMSFAMDYSRVTTLQLSERQVRCLSTNSFSFAG